MKGADRKHKQDREKIFKRPLSEQEKYQPSCECTILSEVSYFLFSQFSIRVQRNNLYILTLVLFICLFFSYIRFQIPLELVYTSAIVPVGPTGNGNNQTPAPVANVVTPPISTARTYSPTELQYVFCGFFHIDNLKKIPIIYCYSLHHLSFLPSSPLHQLN